jgi:hypothetical protein
MQSEIEGLKAKLNDPVSVIEEAFTDDADVIVWLSDQTGETYDNAIAALRQMMAQQAAPKPKARKSLKAA